MTGLCYPVNEETNSLFGQAIEEKVADFLGGDQVLNTTYDLYWL